MLNSFRQARGLASGCLHHSSLCCLLNKEWNHFSQPAHTRFLASASVFINTSCYIDWRNFESLFFFFLMFSKVNCIGSFTQEKCKYTQCLLDNGFRYATLEVCSHLPCFPLSYLSGSPKVFCRTPSCCLTAITLWWHYSPFAHCSQGMFGPLCWMEQLGQRFGLNTSNFSWLFGWRIYSGLTPFGLSFHSSVKQNPFVSLMFRLDLGDFPGVH